MDKTFREKLLKLLLPIGGVSTLVNVPIIYHIDTVFTLLALIIGTAYISIYFFFRNQKLSYNTASNITLFLLFIETLSVPINDSAEMFLLPWILMYPIVTFSLKSSRYGLISSTLLLAVFAVMFLLTYLDAEYNIKQIVTFAMLYITVTIVFYFLNKNSEEKERVLYEQNMQLQSQKELYDLVFENASNGVLLIDSVTRRFVNCNQRVVEMFNFSSKSHILNLHPWELSPMYQPDEEKSDKKANDMMQLAMINGSNIFEWKHLRATGKEFWAEITLTSVIIDGKDMIHVVCKDIDERKKTKEKLEELNKTLEIKVKEATSSLKKQNLKLQESVDNFQDVLDTTIEMIVLIDENQKIIDANQAGINMMGFDKKSEVIGTHISKYVLPSELPKLQIEMSRDVSEPYELLLVKKDGTILPTLASARNIIRDGKKVRISTLMDLTDIKTKENMLQQQSRLAQMGEMISMIAHQWRQPLSAISSCVAAIQIKKVTGKINLDTKLQRDEFIEFMSKRHEEISKYVQTLSHTIDDFRNFFKPDKYKEQVALTIPITRALQIVSGSMNNVNIEMTTEFKNDDKITMYQNEMMQVILNILKNAEDNFMEKSIKEPKITISTDFLNNKYVITIADNGGGIPQDILPNIFDPYFSTKSEKNGTGLGLYMSKIMIEEHHDGEFSAANVSDGVCFKIVLG